RPPRSVPVAAPRGTTSDPRPFGATSRNASGARSSAWSRTRTRTASSGPDSGTSRTLDPTPTIGCERSPLEYVRLTGRSAAAAGGAIASTATSRARRRSNDPIPSLYLCGVEDAAASYVTTNDVRRVPADPHETTIPHRPGVVRVPTFHVHEIRAPRFG